MFLMDPLAELLQRSSNMLRLEFSTHGSISMYP